MPREGEESLLEFRQIIGWVSEPGYHSESLQEDGAGRKPWQTPPQLQLRGYLSVRRLSHVTEPVQIRVPGEF